MTNPISALTELAIASYQYAVQGNQINELSLAAMATGDAVLDGVMRFAFLRVEETQLEQVGNAVSSEPGLEFLRSPANELGFQIVRQGSSAVATADAITSSLLTAAVIRMHFLHLPPSESTFVGLVLENYEELKRAARGEQIRAYRVIGFSGVKLREEDRVATPWGTLYPAPDMGPGRAWRPSMPVTSAILAAPELFPIRITNEPSPDVLPQDEQWSQREQRMRQILPLAFALATVDSNLCAPLMTFQTVLYPFGSGFGWSSNPGYYPAIAPAEPTREELVQSEVWSRRLDQHYVANLQVAYRRIVSAIAQRADKTDALIDAVTAWESILGTGTEVSFRLTAALSKLLEPEPHNRLAFRRDLARIYSLRSRVVHGEPADESVIADATKRAIYVGLKTLNQLYGRSEDWLSAKSEERANRLLLEG